MAGQGRPQRELSNKVWHRSAVAAWLLRRLAPVLALCCALDFSASPLWAQAEVETRLRVVWGGGTPQIWTGSLSVNGGTVHDLQNLGLSADSPGSKELVEGQVRVAAASAQNFDGFDITVKGSDDTRVLVELRQQNPAVNGKSPQPFEVLLSDIAPTTQSQTWDLDSNGNKLIVRRTPGDDLRVSIKRESLVFTPGEEFTFDVLPNQIAVEPNAALRLRMQLFAARSDEELWDTQENLAADNDGVIEAPPQTTLNVPAEEGVYDLVISLHRRGRIDVPGWRSGQITQRKIQFVVIDPETAPTEPDEWHESQTVDPTNPGWRAWTTKIPGMSLIPGMEPKPLNKATPKSIQYAGGTMLELGPGDWQAYPIPITEEGRPHLLEVEFPAETPQTLGISIVETTEAGEVVPIGVDSGVYVPDNTVQQKAEVSRHRLVFWPRTKAPLVLLVNHRRDKPAYFGRIHVYSGPERLPPAPIATVHAERLLAVAFDKLLFPENFSADGELDPQHQQVLDDWSKFYWGTRRLAEYLKYAGYNGAVICVTREGSALYPSAVFTPTPRYDSGIFFTTGQDPIRKDVLEMMFRIFDREGLKLVPSIHFSGSVERLERVRRVSKAAAEGILLQHLDGTQWPARYNPLHPQVQESMRAAARELTVRYANHSSFEGLGIQLAADSFAILPDDRGGLDSHTLNRFRRTAFDGTEPEELRQFRSGADVLRNPSLRKHWLEWRALELSRLYTSIHALIAEGRAEGRLFLLTSELFAGRAQQNLLQPSLPIAETHPVVAASLSAGIKVPLYRGEPGIVLFRPQRYSGSGLLNEQAVNIHMTSPEVDAYFRGLENTDGDLSSGAQLFCERLLLPLPSFDQLQPFGKKSSRTELHTHASPAGFHRRAQWAHALAALDAHDIVDGGAMLALGQEESMLSFVETYQMLPRLPFHAVAPESKSGTQPVVVRYARHQGRTFFYMVNDSPWPVRVTLQFSGRVDVRLQALDSRKWPSPFLATNRWSWTVDLEPYDVVGAWLSDANAKLLDWQVQLPPSVPRTLTQQIAKVRDQAAAAASPSPLNAPRNLDFETQSDEGVAGWQFKTGPGFMVARDPGFASSGQYSLHMGSRPEQRGSALLRSEAFPVPQTGRLYVLVRLKTRDASKQPVLRVALDDQSQYYDFRPVGRGQGTTPLPEQWGDFLFAFEQLPVRNLQKLHLGFDLMSSGEVWIDDIHLYDTWFQADERNALLFASAVAEKDLKQTVNVRSAQQFLDSFWPRFLLTYGKPMTADEEPALRAAALPQPAAEEEKPKRSTMDQIRDRVPKVPLRLPFQR